jgi:hypothetical protein
MQHAAKKRLIRDGGLRLLGDPLPDGIELGNLGLKLGHGAASLAVPSIIAQPRARSNRLAAEITPAGGQT